MGNAPNPVAGRLLIAPPNLMDPNFRRSVVFLCEHGAEGSFGLILNRPLGVHLSDVLEGLDGTQLPLWQGGPVQTDTLHFLHSFGDEIPNSIPIAGGVSWGGDFDILRAFLDENEDMSSRVRFFLGYAGWSPDQLEMEIESGGWILAPGSAETVFDDEPEELWRKILRRMGGEYAVLANFPEDPRLN